MDENQDSRQMKNTQEFRKNKISFPFKQIPNQKNILTALLLFMIVIDVSYIITGLFTTITPMILADLYLSLLVLLIFLSSLIFNLKGYFSISAIIFISAVTIMIFAVSITNFLGLNPYYAADDVNILIFLIFPVLLSGLLLPNTWSIIFTTAIGIGLLVLPFLFNSITMADIIFGPFLLFISISFLTLITSFYRGEKEKRKRWQIIQSKKEVEAMNQELSQAKNELKKLNTHLEEIVVQRTKEIELLIDQKNELINQLGHDLKNPLGPMINLLPILIKKEEDPKKLEILKSINRSANYMKNLVVKTIKLAKLNSSTNEFNFEKLSLSDEVEETAKANMLMFNEKEIQFNNNVSENIFVFADKLQLQELFNNLFNNAVKYSDRKGTLSVNANQMQDIVQISVKDTGIGMTEKEIKKIFDEYYKADSSRHDFDSSGLGMPICKRIVEKHGGKIWAESDGKGNGSIFYFTLPATNKKTNKQDIDLVNECNLITEQIDNVVSK